MKQYRFGKRFWLLVSVAFLIISMVGASLVQTAGYSIIIRSFDIPIDGGELVHGEMYIPKDATAEHKLPLVICQHGSQHNLQMMDMSMIELSRRGFIVISMDTFAHGSTTLGATQNRSEGLISQVVDYAVEHFTMVDAEKIGLVGHSMGAMLVANAFTGQATREVKGEGVSHIIACLNIGYDPTYTAISTGGSSSTNENDIMYYVKGHWGMIAGKFDEYFFKQPDAKNDPAYILESQAVLGWIQQVDPSATKVENGKIYRGPVEGEGDFIRVAYQEPLTHPQEIWDTGAARDVSEFFYEALGVPDGHARIEPTNQVWMFKQAFNCLGLIGIVMFLFNFAMWIIDAVPWFGSLKAKELLAAAPALDTGKKKAIYWIGYVISMAVPAILAMPVMHYWVGKESFTPGTVNVWWGEGMLTELGAWSLVSAVVLLAVLVGSTFLFGSVKERIECWGVKISPKNLWKSFLLAVMTFGAAYLILFFADFWFNTDFRIWLIAMRTFTPNKVLYLLAYAPAFIAFYLVNSILVNGANRVEGRPDWQVTLISCIGNALGIAVLISIQYIVYAQTGTFIFSAMRTHNLYPMVVLVPVGTIVTRKFFRETGSIYLGSITIALLYCMMSITQCAMAQSLIP